jgi:membrane protein
VLGYLTQFAGKASKLGGAGLAVLFVTALALILTIDRTLNGIWRVRACDRWGSGCWCTGQA